MFISHRFDWNWFWIKWHPIWRHRNDALCHICSFWGSGCSAVNCHLRCQIDRTVLYVLIFVVNQYNIFVIFSLQMWWKVGAGSAVPWASAVGWWAAFPTAGERGRHSSKPRSTSTFHSFTYKCQTRWGSKAANGWKDLGAAESSQVLSKDRKAWT